MRLEEKIEELRQILHQILQDENYMDCGKILEISQQIDKYIVEYMINNRSNNNGILTFHQ